MKKLLFTLLLPALLMVAGGCRKNYPIKGAGDNISPQEFAAYVDDPNALVIDVRTAKEFRYGHIRNAVLIDCKTDTFLDAVKRRADKQTTLALYCRSGRRAYNAMQQLEAEGYQVVNLKGGYLKWIEMGMKIVK